MALLFGVAVTYQHHVIVFRSAMLCAVIHFFDRRCSRMKCCFMDCDVRIMFAEYFTLLVAKVYRECLGLIGFIIDTFVFLAGHDTLSILLHASSSKASVFFLSYLVFQLSHHRVVPGRLLSALG